MDSIFYAKERIKANRARAEREYEEVLASLCEDETFEEKYRKLDVLNFEIAKREVFGMDKGDLEREREELKRDVDKQLRARNIRGLGEPNYSCEKCRDTGYINGKKCDCLEKTRIAIEMENNPFFVQLPDRLKDVKYDFYGKNAEKYTKYAKFVNNNFVKGELNTCTLIGASGTGKTYIAQTAVKEMLLSGMSVAVHNAVKLNRVFLEYHVAFLENKGEIWRDLIDPDVLLIDDLGVESVLNNVTVQYLYELLTERADKKTIITSNLDLRRLEDKYGQRIMSRLADKRKSAVILFDGEDYRIK